MRSVSVPSCARCANLRRSSPSCQRQRQSALRRKPVCQGQSSLNGATQDSKAAAAAQRFGWSLKPTPSSLKASRPVIELPVDQIRRPLSRTRSNNDEKVRALMDSIAEIGLQEPIDVLEVDGQYYGFSGCHRYEAHQRLGLRTIKCRIQKANRQTLRMHMM